MKTDPGMCIPALRSPRPTGLTLVEAEDRDAEKAVIGAYLDPIMSPLHASTNAHVDALLHGEKDKRLREHIDGIALAMRQTYCYLRSMHLMNLWPGPYTTYTYDTTSRDVPDIDVFREYVTDWYANS